MTPENQKFDVEAFAKIVLLQLATLRAESIQTQRIVTEILEHQKDKSHSHFLEKVKGQEQKKEIERDRIFRVMLTLVNLPDGPNLTGLDNLALN